MSTPTTTFPIQPKLQTFGTQHRRTRSVQRVLPTNVSSSRRPPNNNNLYFARISSSDPRVVWLHACPGTTMSQSRRDPKDLMVVEPEPVADERSPLLGGQGQEEQDTEALEARARQERREYEAHTVPVADELSTRRLVVTMGSMWLSTFFAALGRLEFCQTVGVDRSADGRDHRLDDRCYALRAH